MHYDRGVVMPHTAEKEILSDYVKLRWTLGDALKAHWFQKPAGSQGRN